MTEWIWPNHDNYETKQLNMTKIEIDKPYETDKPFGVKLMFVDVMKFRSCSNVKVRQCKDFLVKI